MQDGARGPNHQHAREQIDEAVKAISTERISEHVVEQTQVFTDKLAKERTHDLEVNFTKIAPFGKEDTAREVEDHAARTPAPLWWMLKRLLRRPG